MHLIGKTLNNYEILDKLGAGGMGEVYRARDLKLGREVALKMLTADVANDPERMARFQREAKVLASLNHPNIAVLYGLEQSQSGSFLIMEVAEGQDLSDLMQQGPLPMEDAFRIAAGIAAGLEEAHDKGIVHRDLKPANVVVGSDKVKILDFGLASAYAGDPAEEVDILSSPTITQAFTQPGMILGTAAYMSPEQARGKPLDKRTDIWSFGVILYEMLTGDHVFHGETITDTLALVLHRTPDLERLPAATPLKVRRLLTRCFEKDPQLRLRDIGEARITLSSNEADEIEATTSEHVTVASGRGRARVAWAVAALAVVAAGALGWIALTKQAPARPEVRASITPPRETRFNGYGAYGGSLSISPDGSRITFSAGSQGTSPTLYLRSLDSDEAQVLAGTAGARYPFWSPDGRYLAYFVDGVLKKQAIDGGAPVTITEAPDGRGGTWNSDDVIVFAPSTNTSLHRVSASGGSSSPLTKLDRQRSGESTHRFPFFLPDGRNYLYVRASHSAADGDNVNSLWVGTIDADDTRELMQTSSNAAYALGHIFWVRDGFLMARPFDAARLELTGDGFPVGEEALSQPNYWSGAFGVSNAGTLIFQQGGPSSTALSWYDREGAVLGTIGDVGRYGYIRLSPDDTRLAVSVKPQDSGNGDIWVFDVERNVGSRLTFAESNESSPVWSPDGRRIAFQSNRGGPGDIYVRAADGTGEAELLYSSESNDEAWSWSSDGKHIAMNHSEGRDDLWVLSLETKEASSFISTDYDEGWGQFSPDGQWLAYLSNESGTYEAYLTRFPSADGKWQLSTDGAEWLLGWNAAGTEIYCMDGGGSVTATRVTLNELVTIDRPEVLFPTVADESWDSSSDGTRFVIGMPEDRNAAYPITLVVNWQGKR